MDKKDKAVKQVLKEFDNMIKEYQKGKPITKLCYGLNNNHMRALILLQKSIKKETNK